MGIVPAMMVLRSDVVVDKNTVEKISMLCHVPVENIFVSADLPSVYYLPTELYKQNIHVQLYKYFGLTFNKKQSFTK
jgi:CTP synthase